MADACSKSGNSEQVRAGEKARGEQQGKHQAQLSQLAQDCNNNKISTNQAKGQLARQLASNPQGLKDAVNALNKETGSGKTAVDVDARKGENVSVVIYTDGSFDAFDTSTGKRLAPNPAFNPVAVGGSLRFADHKGDLHKNASGAVDANITGEQNRSFEWAGGNCPQRAEGVPNFIPAD